VRKIQSTWQSKCRACGGVIEVGEEMFYDPEGARGKRAEHIDCTTSHEMIRNYKLANFEKRRVEIQAQIDRTRGQYFPGMIVRPRDVIRHHHMGDMDDDWTVTPQDIGTILEVRPDLFLQIEWTLHMFPGKAQNCVSPLTVIPEQANSWSF